ncbi:MAG: response regulator [Salinibacterium sp.]|nr:response regulator [Salinibacterium sp.]
MSRTRILVADDHPVVRGGIVALLGTADDLDVVGEAADGLEAVRLALELEPDVVLMDLRMPGIDGDEATALILAERPGIRVLVLTTYESDDAILEAIEAGASGYLLKAAPERELLAGIRSVAGGEVALAPRVAAMLVQRMSGSAEPGVALSPRELEVLRLVAEAGYAYDSSTFPGKQVCLNGRWHAARPVPHRWPGLSALAELPLPAHAPLPLPFHPSYSLVVGSWYFRLGLRRFRRRGAPLIFLFHLTDLADPLPPAMLPTPQTRFFTLSYQSGPRKRARCRAMLNIVRREYRVMDTLELLTETL